MHVRAKWQQKVRVEMKRDSEEPKLIDAPTVLGAETHQQPLDCSEIPVQRLAEWLVRVLCVFGFVSVAAAPFKARLGEMFS